MILNTETKSKIYAWFQFLMLASLIIFVISLMITTANVSTNGRNLSASLWDDMSKHVLVFDRENFNDILSGTLFYISLFVYVLSVVFGFQIVKFPKRSYHDTVFIMFVIFPIISSIFCFSAQIAVGSAKLTSREVTKRQLKNEKTRIINLIENIDTKEALDNIKVKETTKALRKENKLLANKHKSEQQKNK